MTASKHGQEVRIEQLSDGEKCLIALVADLARRLIIANNSFENLLLNMESSGSDFLKGKGIVLIDEVDLHLHPAWQRMVLPKLRATFPNCQFIVSTHSPQILGEVDASQIRILTQDENNEIHCHIPQQAKGLSSNEILDELMNIPDGLKTLSRNEGVEKQLDTLFELIDDEKFEQVKAEIFRMKAELHGDIPDIVRAEALMTMLGAESGDDAV
jgi:predicted ATP-binding protein involved in virulence